MKNVIEIVPEGSNGDRAWFNCPGCGENHAPVVSGPNAWGWNESLTKPTFTPSLLVQWGSNQICHSFITDGNIRFLNDCTHKFAGQTLPLPPYKI